MCGIFGMLIPGEPAVSEKADHDNQIFTNCESSISIHDIRTIIDKLFRLSESRGKEASGLVIYDEECSSETDSEIPVFKADLKPSKAIKTTEYNEFWKRFPEQARKMILLGHTRLATHGSSDNVENIQPVIRENLIGIHNGIAIKSPLFESDSTTDMTPSDSDSVNLFNALNVNSLEQQNMEVLLKELFREFEGSASIGMIDRRKNALHLTTNTGSLYYAVTTLGLIFASEGPLLHKLIVSLKNVFKTVNKHIQTDVKSNISQLKPGSIISIDLAGNMSKTSFTSCFPSQKSSENPDANITDQRENNDYYQRIFKVLKEENFSPDSVKDAAGLKRCTRCILPETIPFISFDGEGVCNYCKQHKQIEYRGREELEKLIAPYRRDDGKPDCLVAFSGGRDSAYALHYMKKVLGMNPLAFTFDWGMVADVARRNQARIVGKLGVEHVVVAADIREHRTHIKSNVSAWLKKPHPGMVVLFMAGDKPAEYYTREVARRYGIDLVILCRGNELENTDFKWGFLGMPEGEPGGVLHDLSFMGRLQFAYYSGLRFLENPRYFNKALGSTLFSFWTTYVLRYDFTYLWHYIPWYEDHIVQTLIDEYNWEVPDDTVQSWRIDDGTSPFYNFIYHTFGGFTENDCFRSNQVREGRLTREQALVLATAENRYRYDAIKDYLGKIGLNYRKTLKRIRKQAVEYRRKHWGK